MSMTLAHQLLHIKPAVSLTDPWAIVLLLTLVFVLVGELCLLVMFELPVFPGLL